MVIYKYVKITIIQPHMGIYRNINAQSMFLHTNKEMCNPMINHAYKASCYKALKIDFTNMRFHTMVYSM